MKVPILACMIWLLPTLLLCQTTDPVLDSLKRPLPKGATVRQEAERLRSILWYIYRDEEAGYENYPQQLDSLLHCCLAGKTSNPKYEERLAAEVSFFEATAIVYDQPDIAKAMLEIALKQYGALNDSACMVQVYSQLCNSAAAMGDSLTFAKYYDESKRLIDYEQDPFLIALFHNNIGIGCYDFGRYAEAAHHYFEALALIEKHKTMEMIAVERDVLHNLSGIYNRIGDMENALIYGQKAIQSAIKTGQDPRDHHTIIAWSHIQRKEYQKALEIFLTASELNNNSNFNNIAEKTYGLATCYRNLGDVKKALPLAQKAVELLPLSKSVHYGGAALHELAACEFASGMTDAALKNALLAFHSFVTGKNNRGAAEAAELLRDIYKSKGNFIKALKYSDLRNKYQQQVERQQSTRQLAFGEFTRESEVKNAQREAEVKAQLVRQRNIRYTLFVGLGILALLAFLLYNRYRFKQRTNEQLEAKNLEVEAARHRAEKSEAFKTRFLANMSHEIRTPLHGISGYTDLVLETSLTEKQRHYLSAIYHSTERLTEVVNDILDISKLEAGEVRLRQVPFSPDRIVRDVQEALSVRAENKGIELNVHIGEGVPAAVLGDPTRLYQILMNLAANAVKFTEKGEVRLAIDGSIAHPLTSLTFSISDTGIGIPSEKLANIFDSFQQASEDTTARFGGTGLGLTIARELVQLHGSDIWVESEVGKGSNFSFILNLPVADAANLEQPGGDRGDLYFSQKLNILLADDNAFNREIASEALLRHFENAEITEAENGWLAVGMLHATSPHHGFDLILMDMQMPEMNGTDATRHIRQELGSGIPIIALTASATPEEIEQALESGMNRHLAKPFKPHELALAIAATLGLEAGSARALPGSENLEKLASREVPGKYDLTYLRDFCGGDEVQVRHFLEKFEAQCPLEIERLEAAFRNEDREAVYQAAHSFKPQLEFVGWREAAAVVAELEEAARARMPVSKLAKLLGHLKVLTTSG